MKSFLKLYSFTKGTRGVLVLGIFGGAVKKCMAAFLAANLFASAIDLAPKGMHTASITIMKAVPVLFIIILLHIFSRLAREKACIESAGRLRCVIIEKTMKSTLSSLRKIESARVLSSLSSDAGMAFDNLASVLVAPTTALLLGISGVLYIASMNDILGFFVLLMAIIQGLYSLYLAIHMRKVGQRWLQARADTHSNLQETMEGIIAVRMDNLEPLHKRRFEKSCQKEQKCAVQYGTFSGIIGGINNGISQMNEKVLLGLSGFLAIKGILSLGQIVEVVGLASNVAGICNVSRLLTDTQVATAGALRIFELLDALEAEPLGIETANDKMPTIKAINLNFSYPDQKELIKNASFEIVSGKVVLLMGPSGSGKTTLLRLIQAMEQPVSGELQVCGIKVACWKRKALRSRIAYVPQEPMFFSGTILENLYDFGVSDIEQAIWAAKLTNIHERISQLEYSYNTYLNDMRSVFSGGELQRLALARALCRKADILILDEPTSALDRENEQLLYDAIKNCKNKRIVILCTHKLSAICIADEIISIENGKVQQHFC